jgi:hypothetical protein
MRATVVIHDERNCEVERGAEVLSRASRTYCGFHVGRHVWLELVTVHVDGEEQPRRISADRITLCAD